MNEDSKPKATLVMSTSAANMRAFTGGGAAEVRFPMRGEPDVTGPHGRAWLCDEAEGLRRMKKLPAEHGGVAHWIVEAPWAHPVWHSYSIVLIHLRPMADGRQTIIHLPGATHELWAYALDPSVDLNAMRETGIVNGWLQPMNFGAQFIEIRDDLAAERVKFNVQDICDGTLSPDTDFLGEWIKRFGDNMVKVEFR